MGIPGSQVCLMNQTTPLAAPFIAKLWLPSRFFFPGGPLTCSIKLVFFSVVVLLSYYSLVADIIQF